MADKHEVKKLNRLNVWLRNGPRGNLAPQFMEYNINKVVKEKDWLYIYLTDPQTILVSIPMSNIIYMEEYIVIQAIEKPEEQ